MKRLFLSPQLIAVGETAADWQEAVRKGGSLLVQAGLVLPEYVQKMIDSIETFGPYVVIAPGVALPHARPEHGVKETGISVTRFCQPVSFGPNPEQQVEVIICLAAADSASHLDVLQLIAAVVGDQKRRETLKRAKTREEIVRCFETAEEDGR